MYLLKKNFLLPFLIFSSFLISCNDKDNCAFPDYERTRENFLNLDSETESSLNLITNILDGSYDIVNSDANDKILAYSISHEIFFKLSEENKVLHIQEVYYSSPTNLSHYFNYDVPISQLSIDNIEIKETSINGYGNYSIVEFNSKLNNPEAFTTKTVKFEDDGSSNLIQCSKDGFFRISLQNEDAKQLKDALASLIQGVSNTY